VGKAGKSCQDRLNCFLPSAPLHLSSSDDGVDLKSPAQCPTASDLKQPSGKRSLAKVAHEKSSGPLETEGNINP